MSNEIILILSLFVTYSGVLVAYKLFRTEGLYACTVIVTIAANIEVLILIKAFGIDQTLGNVLFASTFLITDILSELEGKEKARKAVNLGIFTSITFIIITQSWMLYTPSAEDFASPAIREVFSVTPRIMLTSLAVYGIVQHFDVWAFHKWWAFTEKWCGDKKKYLWLRNSGSTLISQLLNTVLFTIGAFWGQYGGKTLISIMVSSYIIFIFTTLADTPFVYLARKIKK